MEKIIIFLLTLCLSIMFGICETQKSQIKELKQQINIQDSIEYRDYYESQGF